jgi:putative membrane protein
MFRTIPEEKRNWFRFVFQLRASVLPAILPRILVCCGFALGVTIADQQGWPVSLPVESSIVPSLVLGLLLVFRTNTAYERFWEGRKQWGTLVNTVRNLARQIWVTIAEETAQDRAEKRVTMRLLVAFAVTTKRHLRSETMACAELVPLMPEHWCDRLTTMNNPPLEVAFWIGDYLQLQYDRDRITAYQLAAMFKLLDTMVDVLGACERILKTPIPLAYSIHLKQLLLIYCLGLSFQMVDEFRWWTAVVVGLVSFTVFGIEEIGIEIENPFGYDRNDLPLDQICQTMAVNIEDLITLAPSVQQWRESPSTLDETPTNPHG